LCADGPAPQGDAGGARITGKNCDESRRGPRLAPLGAQGTMFAQFDPGSTRRRAMKMLEAMKMLTILVVLAASALILMA
jgi:hypothetical protein